MTSALIRIMIANATTCTAWLATHPCEDDLWAAIKLEKAGANRSRILDRLQVRAQRLERRRVYTTK